jgi:hypothetical protein
MTDPTEATREAAKEAAREARQLRALATTEEAPFDRMRREIEELRKDVEFLREQNVQIATALAETFDATGARLDDLSIKVRNNERMISQKTIEILTRAQVARIMRDEAKVEAAQE